MLSNTQAQTSTNWLETAQVGHQDIIRLAGLIFLHRNFVQEIEEKGLEAVIEAECFVKDLTEDQRLAFQQAFNHPPLRQLVQQWWRTYDQARQEGVITSLEGWEP